jgi:hypothetical protein
MTGVLGHGEFVAYLEAAATVQCRLKKPENPRFLDFCTDLDS